MFTEEDIQRYSRHIILPEVGGKGQMKLREGKVLMIGAGGLGSPVSLYLAAAGIGTLGIVDMDTVDLSNLQRQVLHTTNDVGRPKVESAKETLTAINPGVKVNAYRERLGKDNVLELVNEYDVIVDGVDNFPTRFLLNDACVMAKKPLVEAGILRWDGMV
ncbi:MAG: HesA/MoeB/ThiF family protein, partial [Clostridia bacterium]|nr:HesA/MoeB/ThiF family protein [Clostridia bacterium]